jgi:hypothetical protein
MSVLSKLKKALGLTSPAPAPAPPLRLPNFFISGAARCGTTSMWQYLRQHPDIHMPPAVEQKEPSHYCEIYGVHDRAVYLSLFKDAGTKKMVGEASGPYLTSPDSPGRIQKEIPNAQFIILLRNPAKRAFSLYKWMQENGYEKCGTFEEALKAEKETRFQNDWFIKNNGQYYYNFLYFNSGLYYEQVKRFYDTFGREQVLVFIFEEFAENTASAVKNAYSFLGVDPSFQPKLEVHNATQRKHSFDPALRAELMRQYAPNIAQLEQLLGRDLRSVWT